MHRARPSRRPPAANATSSAAPSAPAAARELLPLYAVLVVLGIALPLLLIRHRSLWYDELFAVYFAAQGPDYLLHEGWTIETSPPLYYMLLWFWTEIFGRSEVALRALSLIAHVATLPVVYAIARKLDLGAASWRAVVLYAFGAVTVNYAIMARTFALWTLLLALAILAMASALRALEASDADRRVLMPAIGFAAATVAALYAHNMTIVFAASADATFLAAWWWQRGRSWRSLAAWVAPQIAALVVAAPQFVVIAHQANSPNISWILRASPRNALAVAFDLFGGMAYPLMLLRTAVSVLVFGMFVWGAAVAIRRRSPVAALAGTVAVAFALLYVISLWRPILAARSVAWTLLPVSIVVAAAIDRVRAGVPRLAAILAIAGLCAANAGFGIWMSLEESWRDVVAAIAASKQPGDVVVVMDRTPISALLYYAPGAAGWTLRHWFTSGSGEAVTAGDILEDRIAPVPATTPRDMRAFLNQGRAVWLLSETAAEIPLHEAFDAQALPGIEPTIRMRRGFILLSRVAQPGH